MVWMSIGVARAALAAGTAPKPLLPMSLSFFGERAGEAKPRRLLAISSWMLLLSSKNQNMKNPMNKSRRGEMFARGRA
jgi:hypothetical protein